MAHAVTEAKRSHDLLSVSWRPRKAHDVTQSDSKDLRTRSTDVQGQKEMDVPAQAESVNSPFLAFVFCSGP